MTELCKSNMSPVKATNGGERDEHSCKSPRDPYPRAEHNPLPLRRHQDGPGVADLEALARLRMAARRLGQVDRGRLGGRERRWGGKGLRAGSHSPDQGRVRTGHGVVRLVSRECSGSQRSPLLLPGDLRRDPDWDRLILGAFTGIAAFFGVFMNASFIFAGTAGANPLMALVAILLV